MIHTDNCNVNTILTDLPHSQQKVIQVAHHPVNLFQLGLRNNFHFTTNSRVRYRTLRNSEARKTTRLCASRYSSKDAVIAPNYSAVNTSASIHSDDPLIQMCSVFGRYGVNEKIFKELSCNLVAYS